MTQPAAAPSASQALPPGAAGHGCGRARTAPGRIGGRIVHVDGLPVCETCGVPVERVGRDTWHHAPPGGRRAPSRWSAPLRAGDLAATGSFDALVRRYPWLADAHGGAPVVMPEDWVEARRRDARVEALLAAPPRGEVARGANPYAAAIGALLGVDADPGADLATALTSAGRWRGSSGVQRLLDLPGRRRQLVAAFAWAVPARAALDALAGLGPLLEVGAGTGYWTALLQARGVDVVATDVRPPAPDQPTAFHAAGEPWAPVVAMAGTDAVRRHPGRTLFLCWPPYDDDAAAYDPLRAYRGDRLAYAGELDGPTASPRFRRELRANWALAEAIALPCWPGLRDRLHVFERNAERLPVLGRDRCPGCGRYAMSGAVGRCDRCFARRPPALAIRVGAHRVEYGAGDLAALPIGVAAALARSPNRIR